MKRKWIAVAVIAVAIATPITLVLWRRAPTVLASSQCPQTGGGSIRVVRTVKPSIVWDSSLCRAEYRLHDGYLWSSLSVYADDVVIRSASIAWGANGTATVSLEGRPVFFLQDRKWSPK
jgi:hypothetical protein